MKPSRRSLKTLKSIATSAGAVKRPGGSKPSTRRVLHRAGRLCGRLRRFAPARPITLRRRLRTPRCRTAAERPEGSRDLTHLGTQGRDHDARQGLLRQARARQADISCAANDSVLFHAVWGLRRAEEQRRLSTHARAILKVLRKEWEMGTKDLRDESGVKDRARFTKALDELQAAMIVVPTAAVYAPKFTYIWSLGIDRFPGETRQACESGSRREGNCPLFSGGRRHDDSRRAGSRDGPVAAGSGEGEPCARGGRLRDEAGSRRVPTRREGAIRPGGGEHRARAKGSHSRRGRRTTRAARRLRLPEAATP